MNFEEYKKNKLENPELRAAHDELEPEYGIIRQLIQARDKLNLTQAELAKRAGTDQAHISRLEHGNYNPSLKLKKT